MYTNGIHCYIQTSVAKALLHLTLLVWHANESQKIESYSINLTKSISIGFISYNSNQQSISFKGAISYFEYSSWNKKMFSNYCKQTSWDKETLILMCTKLQINNAFIV